MEKLTEYHTAIMRHVKEVDYFNNGKTTVAILTMKNGFDVVGTSSCVHRDSFDTVLGRHYALVDALGKMDAFIGFGRQQEAYEQKMYVQEQEEIKRVQEEMAKEEEKSNPTLHFSEHGISKEDYDKLHNFNQKMFEQNQDQKDQELVDAIQRKSKEVVGVLNQGEGCCKKAFIQGGYINSSQLEKMNKVEKIIPLHKKGVIVHSTASSPFILNSQGLTINVKENEKDVAEKATKEIIKKLKEVQGRGMRFS